MITANTTLRPNVRARVARERHREAYASLSACRLCARQCGVNRLKGEKGYCRSGVAPHVFSAQVEVGDEADLTPSFAVALSGCNLRCAFCITAARSQEPDAGAPLDLRALREQVRDSLACGINTVTIYGGEPTVHLPWALAFIAALPKTVRIVWKTNAYAALPSCQWLDGLIDVCLADYKFGNDTCAMRLAQAPDYVATVQDYLIRASEHGAAVIRHLLMPGHVKCCWAPVASWISRQMPDVSVSLQTAFWPRATCAEHPELEKTVAEEERQLALDIGRDYHLRFMT